MDHYQEIMLALSESVTKKSPEAQPGGGQTMISYPACNITSLSRKPFIADKKLLWITIMKSWSLSNLKKTQQTVIKKT